MVVLINHKITMKVLSLSSMFLSSDKAALIIFTCWLAVSIVVVRGESGSKMRIDEAGGGNENVDKKAVLTRPLTQGIYQFQEDGTVPKSSLKRLRVVHAEMIKTLKSVNDPSKLSRYLLSISNTVQEDVDVLHKKFLQSGIGNEGKLLNKQTLKADAFVFLAGHASLISHLVMYFPDGMRKLLKKNSKLDESAKWAIRFTVDAHLVNEEKTATILNLAQQELEMIPRDEDFQNPYRLEEILKQDPQESSSSTTTTKKPRKRLQRGPRLSGGGAEL